MSLAYVLSPGNGYDLYARSFNGNQGNFDIVYSDQFIGPQGPLNGNIFYDSLTQNNGLSGVQSNGNIFTLGQVSSTTGFFTPGTVDAGIEVNAPVVNCDDLVASDDIVSTAGEFIGSQNCTMGSYQNTNSSFIVLADGDTTVKNLNAPAGNVIGAYVKASILDVSQIPPFNIEYQLATSIGFTKSSYTDMSGDITLTGLQALNGVIFCTNAVLSTITLPASNEITGLPTFFVLTDDITFPLTIIANGSDSVIVSSSGTFPVAGPSIVNAGTRTTYVARYNSGTGQFTLY